MSPSPDQSVEDPLERGRRQNMMFGAGNASMGGGNNIAPTFGDNQQQAPMPQAAPPPQTGNIAPAFAPPPQANSPAYGSLLGNFTPQGQAPPPQAAMPTPPPPQAGGMGGGMGGMAPQIAPAFAPRPMMPGGGGAPMPVPLNRPNIAPAFMPQGGGFQRPPMGGGGYRPPAGNRPQYQGFGGTPGSRQNSQGIQAPQPGGPPQSVINTPQKRMQAQYNNPARRS